MTATCLIGGCDRPAKTRGLCPRCYARCRHAGLPRIKEPDWSPDEIDFLLDNVGRLGYAGVGKALGRKFGFARTEMAVLLKARRLHVTTYSARGDYNLGMLGRILHVCPKHIKRAWAAHGLRICQIAGPRGICTVSPDDLRAFLLKHPEAADWTRLSDFDRARLGLANMPERPRSKRVECSCGRVNIIPLMATANDRRGHCHFCGRRMTKWASSYTHVSPTPLRRPKSTLDEMSYYDADADRVRCLDCGARRQAINWNHVRTHGHANVIAYRKAHGLPADAPLVNKGSRYRLGHNWGKNTRHRHTA